MKVLIDDRIQEYTPEEIYRWTAELPQWRREKVESIKHDTGRRQSLLAYRLLCRGLREEYGITETPTFTYGEHGKPFLSGEWRVESGERFGDKNGVACQEEKLSSLHSPLSTLHFSLSHCREAVACIIDDRPCGIDIESVGRKASDSLIRYSMNEEEIGEIKKGGTDGKAFLRLWTRKEAVLKLIGTGIRDTMKDVLVNCPYDIETRETERWVMSIATLPG